MIERTSSFETKPIDEENLDLMLEFAGEYEMRDLRRRCVDFIAAKIDKTPKGLRLLNCPCLTLKGLSRPQEATTS